MNDKNSFLKYLSDLRAKVPMPMFRAMHLAIENDNIKAAWFFYKNDLDKLDRHGNDLEIRNTIESFFRNLNPENP